MKSALSSLLKAEAYSAYFSKRANAEAQRLYQEAIDADNTFARPCAELAYAILQAYLYNWYEGEPADAIQKMNFWADKALEKDPDDPNNIWIKTDVSLYSKDFDAACSGYASLGGAQLNKPMPAESWAYPVDYADFKVLTGDAKLAISIVNQAVTACPVPEKWFYWVLAWAYYVDGQFQASLEALSHFPNPRNTIRKNVVANLVALGRLGEAQVQASTFLVEEKAQGITYATRSHPVFPGLSLIEDRIPFQHPAMLQRWKDDLEQAFGGLVQP